MKENYCQNNIRTAEVGKQTTNPKKAKGKDLSHVIINIITTKNLYGD